jgi:glucose dehydrogenase
MTKVVTKIIGKVITNRMKKTLSNPTMRALALAILFIISGIGASLLINPAAAAPNAAPAAVAPSASASAAAAPAALSAAEANWASPNGNQFNWDYNPQMQINSSDAQNLGLSWLFPLPGLPVSLIAAGSTAFDGIAVAMQIMIVNGTAFAINNFDEVFAFNIANGNVLWTYQTPISVNESISGAGVDPQGAVDLLVLHHHDGNELFTTGTFAAVSGPTLWYQAADRKVYAVNAITGKEELNFTTFTGRSMVPGDGSGSTYRSDGPANIVIDQTRGILVSSIDAESSADNGRGYYAAWNINVNPPKQIWVAFTTPPQPGGNLPLDPNWAAQDINNMSYAYTFWPGKGAANGYTTPAELQGGLVTNTNDSAVINWKSLSPAQLNASLYNDWGQVDQSAQCQAIDGGGSTGSTGASWGGPWLLGSGPTSGILYAGTNNKDPFVGPCNPGPDLWSASTLALNITNGHWIWGFQTTTHDIWDYDCSWWQALGNETINGVNTPVVFKTCKDGFLFELNALTGDLIWAWSPPTSEQPRCAICWPMNPLNTTQTSFDFPTAFLTYKTQPTTGAQPPFLQYPSELAGFESEQSYNPATNTLFVASHIVPYFMTYVGLNGTSYYDIGVDGTGEVGTPVNTGSCSDCVASNNNATIWSINAATGAANWHYFIPEQGFRGAVTLTGNMVLATLSSGDMLMINQQTGKLVRDFYIGAAMDVAASVGASVNGSEYIIMPAGTCSLEAAVTCPGSTPGDIVALSLQSSAGSPATSTTATASGSLTATAAATTVTATVTATTTATVTSASSAGSSTTLYSVAAVAVIFIIATGYLAMRGRGRPAT